MKAVTIKMLISLVGVAVSAPFILIALVAGARAIELARGAQDEALLVVLALSGAVISMINGFGRRTGKSRGKGPREEKRAEAEPKREAASVVNLSY